MTSAATTQYPMIPLNQVTGGSSTFSYDQKGNRTSNYKTFVYNDENQQVQYRYRMFVDGLVIKCGTVGYVVTPVDPLGVKDSIELHKLDDLEKH